MKSGVSLESSSNLASIFDIIRSIDSARGSIGGHSLKPLYAGNETLAHSHVGTRSGVITTKSNLPKMGWLGRRDIEETISRPFHLDSVPMCWPYTSGERQKNPYVQTLDRSFQAEGAKTFTLPRVRVLRY